MSSEPIEACPGDGREYAFVLAGLRSLFTDPRCDREMRRQVMTLTALALHGMVAARMQGGEDRREATSV
jgi:hypothetical protein